MTQRNLDPPPAEQFLVLAQDAVMLEARISALGLRNLFLAELIEEAIGQSSETTHDNAPYDAVVHEKYIVDTQLAQFRGIQAKMEVVDPPVQPTSVGVGTEVEFELSDGKKIHIKVAGHWHDRNNTGEDHLVVSLNSPIGRKLTGLAVGSTVELVSSEEGTITAIAALDDLDSFPHAEGEEQKDDLDENETTEWKKNRVLFISGPDLVGKTTLANLLASTGDYVVFEIDDLLRQQYEGADLQQDFEEWKVSLQPEEKAWLVSERIHLSLTSSQPESRSDGVIVVGASTKKETDEIADLLDCANSKTVYVNASKNTLLDRYIEKQKGGKKKATKKEREEMGVVFNEDFDRKLRSLFLLAESADHKFLNMDGIEKALNTIIGIVEEWKPST